MPDSPQMQERLDFSYVPTLNVKYKIIIDIDTVSGHMDIVTYITGDAFPNCEALLLVLVGELSLLVYMFAKVRHH